MASKVWLPSMIALLMICAVALTGCDVPRAVDEAGRMLERLSREEQPPKAEIDWDRYRRPYIPLKDEELEARIREFYRAAFDRELESVNCSGPDRFPPHAMTCSGAVTRSCSAFDRELDNNIRIHMDVFSGDVVFFSAPYYNRLEGTVLTSTQVFEGVLPVLRYFGQPLDIASYYVIPEMAVTLDGRVDAWSFYRVLEHEGVPCVWRWFSVKVCAVTAGVRVIACDKRSVPGSKTVTIDKAAALRIATARVTEGTVNRPKHLSYEVVQDVDRILLTITPALPYSERFGIDLMELGYSPFDVFYTWAVPVVITSSRHGSQEEWRLYIDTETGIAVNAVPLVPTMWLIHAVQ